MNLRDYGFYNTPQDYNDNNSVNYAGKSPVKDFDTLSWLIGEIEFNEYKRKGEVSFDYTDVDISGLDDNDQKAFFAYLHKKGKYYKLRKNNVVRVALAEGAGVGFFTRYFVTYGEAGLWLPFVIPVILTLICLAQN